MTDTSKLICAAPITPLNVGGIHTQANNFLQAVHSGVDPRTGQFNLAINVPLGAANNLTGPTLSLTWLFSSLSSHRDLGFGLGWSLALSQLTLAVNASSLSLSSGEQFSVNLDESDLSIGGKLAFYDYKLEALRVIRHDETSFRVEHKTGEMEVLRQVDNRGSYVLHELLSPEGRKLYLNWSMLNDVAHLIEVRDEQRTLARINRQSGSPTLELEPATAQQSDIQFLVLNNQLQALLLPTLETPFNFAYTLKSTGKGQQLLFPSEVNSPLGTTDTVVWTAEANSHQLPDDAPLQFLPRVSTWLHTDGAPETTLLRSYEWVGRHNHFGYGSTLGFKWQSGRDNLYQLREAYEYSVIETQLDASSTTLATITRQWDRHHLLTFESTVSGDCQVNVETTYGIDYDKSWPEQEPWCQLPHCSTTTYVDGKTGKRRSEQVTYTYDRYGNVLTTLYPTGVQEHCEYYPATGEEGACPFDASGMVRYLKRKTISPAPNAPGTAPKLATRYEYQNLPSLIEGNPDHAVVMLEELTDMSTGRVLETTRQVYELIDKQHYGRPKKITTRLGGKDTTTALEYRIESIKDQRLLRTTTTIKGFENNEMTQSSSSDVRSLITGQTAWEISTANVRTDYHFDALGRITRTVIAAGSQYEASRTCAYHLNDEFASVQAPHITRCDGSTKKLSAVGIEETDATGQRKRTWLDGSGRAVLVQLEDIDWSSANPEQPARFFDMESSAYDAQGRITRQTTWDWAPGRSEPLMTLTSRFEYDDWGSLSSQIDPTGVITHSVHDPVAQRSEQWSQSASGALSGKQVIYNNVAGSPKREEYYDNRGQLVRTTDNTRDGLDRVIAQRITPAKGEPLVTRFEYDAYSRLTRRTLPDDTVVVWTYLAYSDSDHPESITVEAPPVKAGSTS
ncbi:RHS repeat domain-containing protein [Pseudomonas sp. NUPR-001]|uniref:RHS repeat domain-containing protein n=1 Tax=Pseudomonas sp. NUPR-001 TaxID=3416058 RepID=UPI003F96A33F